jgi:Na+/proline symporter
MLKHMTDRQFLRAMRITLWGFGSVVLVVALNSELSIFKMVENAYKITLVAAFVPLAFGLYWKRANTQGALTAMVMGLSTWVLCEVFEPSAVWPPQLLGFMMSILGMLAGSLLPNLIGIHAEPHRNPNHHIAAQPEHSA